MNSVTRRRFIKNSFISLAAGSAIFSASKNLSAGQNRKPNIVIFLTDDQGSVDVNCYGASDLITPHLDALAERGTRFSQFYVASSICSPSRAALLTGRFPQRAQLPGNAIGGDGMPSKQITMAELFKEHGYRTGIFGKWHLGTALPLGPNEQGFDEFLGHREGCIDNYSHFYYWRGPNRHDLWRDETEIWENGTYFPDICVREATRFIKENRVHPFFLYVPFNVPHYPMQAERKYVDMYDHINDPQRKRYAAFVSMIDDRIGQILQVLKEQNLFEDTLVLFMSDHGHSVEERAFGGGGSAGPYRGHKKTMWEGGLRVPCIISWPGHIPKNSVRDQLACSIDWLPTLADYAGIGTPDWKVDGKSLVPMINDKNAKSPHNVMHWMLGPRWAVRKGVWKLVFDQELFLANLDRDISEQYNYINEYPEKAEMLKSLHQQWAESVSEQ
ncbi:MAG: sulfatase-like hydrolase/transferase [candidate division KSB1 bacterium]|nr:sulfatase-like hydrolase/transferase [candidate division KSB1 bacterium]